MRSLILFALGITLLVTSYAPADEAKELRYDGKVLAAWIEQLHDNDPHARKRAADALAEAARASRAAVRPLVAKLMAITAPDEEEEVRRIEAYGYLLREVGPAAAEALHRHLWGDDEKLKLRALRLLAVMGSHARPAVPGLIEVLETDKDEKRFGTAMLAVSRLNDPAFRAVLLKLLEDADIARWRPAADILARGNYPPADFLPILRKWLRGDDADRRRAALAALLWLGREAAPAWEELAAVLKREEQIERAAATMILRHVAASAKAAIPALEAMLKGGSDKDKAFAAQALFRISDHAGAKDLLVKLAKEGKAIERLAAAPDLWWRTRSPEVPAALKHLLANGTPGERHEAARLAGRLGPAARDTVPELIKLLDSPAKGLKGEAIGALGRMGSDAKAAVKALRREAEVSKEEEPRSVITLALARIDPDKAVIDDLTVLLSSQDGGTRRLAMGELGDLGAKAQTALAEVRKRLADSDPYIQSEAIEALWLISRDPDLLGELRKRLHSENAFARRSAAMLIGSLFRTDAEPAVGDLIAMIWEDTTDSNAVEALSWLGPAAKKAVPALTKLIRTPHLGEHVYSSAAEALGLIGADGKQAVAAIKGLLKHRSAYVRTHAALSLARLGAADKDAEAVVEQAAANRSPRVVITGLEARWLLDRDARVIEDLILQLRDMTFSEDPIANNVRFMAARALGRIGPPAKAALPDLKDLLYDEDVVLRRHVREVIGRIEKK